MKYGRYNNIDIPVMSWFENLVLIKQDLLILIQELSEEV